MRQDILLLDQARYNQRLHSLSNALVPSSGKTLDNLIDLSPIRLPDAFLDVQEKLEDDTSAFTQGLSAFLGSLIRQWRTADEIYWSAIEDIEGKVEEMQRELEAALLKEPDEALVAFFQQQYNELDNLLRQLKTNLDSLVQPTHRSVPDQPAVTQKLIACLDEILKQASSSLFRVSELIKMYRKAASALSKCNQYRAACEASTETFRALSRSLAECMATLPSLQNEDCIEKQRTADEDDVRHRIGELSARVRAETAEAQVLNKDASAALVDLWQISGVDPNVKRSLRDVAQKLLDASNRSNGIVKQAEQDRIVLDLARHFHTQAEQSFEAIRVVRDSLEDATPKAYWSSEKQRCSPAVDAQAKVDQLRTSIDDRLLAPMMQADSLKLDRSHPRLLKYMELGASRVRDKYAGVVC